MKTLFFSFVILCISFVGFSNTESFQAPNCDAPVNLTVISQSHNAISFDWDEGSNSFSGYAVYYTKDGQTSQTFTTNKSEISFTGLAPGVYQFHFYTDCSGTSSSIIIEDAVFG